MSEENWPTKDEWEAATEDYRIAWDYYKITFEERARIYNNFFTTIAMPSSVVAAVLIFLPRFVGSLLSTDSEPKTANIVSNMVTSQSFGVLSGCVILVFFLAGLSMFILHCYEEQTSKDYLGFMNNVRRRLGSRYPPIRGYLKIPDPKNDNRPRILKRPASFWRIMTMAILNSLLFPVVVAMIADTILSISYNDVGYYGISFFIFAYILSFFVHIRIRDCLLRPKPRGS